MCCTVSHPLPSLLEELYTSCPPLFLFHLFYRSAYRTFVLTSALISLVVGGFYMLIVLDLRYLIVVSSMANNSFLLIGIISGSLSRFFFYYSLYFINILLLLFTFKGLLKPLIYTSRDKASMVILLMLLLLNIAALPPIPMFLAKFIVIYNYLIVSPLSLSFLIVLVLCNVAMIASYCQLFMKYVTQVYSHSSFHLLY